MLGHGEQEAANEEVLNQDPDQLLQEFKRLIPRLEASALMANRASEYAENVRQGAELMNALAALESAGGLTEAQAQTLDELRTKYNQSASMGGSHSRI